MVEVALVHLASASLGPEPFHRFISSYREHAAGLAHELIIVFNGFPDAASVESAGFSSLLEGIQHRPAFRSPLAIDLRAYREVGRDLQTPLACFLNANSVILADDWLAKLHRHASRPGVGIVGATGSFETHRDGLPARGPILLRRARRLFGLRTRRDFGAFPNPHIRTNAFMVRPAVLRALDAPPLQTKADAYRFESGRRSLTALIRQRGLGAEVIGRDGCAYPIDSWPMSGTFRSGDQDNLLVSDSRTREWDSADPFHRHHMASVSWGPMAREVPLGRGSADWHRSRDGVR